MGSESFQPRQKHLVVTTWVSTTVSVFTTQNTLFKYTQTNGFLQVSRQETKGEISNVILTAHEIKEKHY